jgi:hypothetical protein
MEIFRNTYLNYNKELEEEFQINDENLEEYNNKLGDEYGIFVFDSNEDENHLILG